MRTSALRNSENNALSADCLIRALPLANEIGEKGEPAREISWNDDLSGNRRGRDLVGAAHMVGRRLLHEIAGMAPCPVQAGSKATLEDRGDSSVRARTGRYLPPGQANFLFHRSFSESLRPGR